MKEGYIVKIKMDYCEACFKFKDIEDAAKFMREACQHKEKGKDEIKITIEAEED